MVANYVKMTVEALTTLPVEKQSEVYDFARFLNAVTPKSAHRPKATRPNGSSLLKMVGTLEGPTDMAANHDAIYDN